MVFVAKNYCILRVAKVKSARAVFGAVQHNTRERVPLNADPARLGDNLNLTGSSDAVMDRYAAMLPEKVRKDAVHALEFVVTLSGEAFERLGWPQAEDYFRQASSWILERVGGSDNLLSAAIHRDEAVPHLHMLVMPLVNGKLNAKALMGGHRDRMRDLQTDFAETVGKPFGLDRGVEKSGYRHTEPKEFPRIMAEAKDTLEYARGEMRRLLATMPETVKDFTKKDMERCWGAFAAEAQSIHREKALKAQNQAAKRSSGHHR